MRRVLIYIFSLYTIISLLFFWPLALHAGNSVVDAGDPLFYAWNLVHNWQSFTHGFRHLLDTNIYFPTTNTLALSDTLFLQTALTAPILWISNNPVLAENIYILLTFPLAGLGMFLLARRITKQNLPSLLAGLFYAFSLPRLGQIAHLPMISSQWLPYLFYFLLRFLDDGKRANAFLFSIFFIANAASSVYLGIFASVGVLIVGGIALALPRQQKKSVNLNVYVKSVLLFVIPVITILIVLHFPYIRLKAEHPEIQRSLAEASARGAYQEDYTAVTKNTLFTGKILPTKEGERALYLTSTVIVLALLSWFVIPKKLRTIAIAFGGLAIISFLLSFGPERPFTVGPFDTGYIRMPYYYAYKLFPPLQIIRVPSRFSVLTALSLSLLAAMTLTYAKFFKKYPWVSLVTGMLFLLEVWQAPVRTVIVSSYRQAPPVYQWLKNQGGDGPIIELPIAAIETGSTPIEQQVEKHYDALTQNDPLATETYRVYFAGYHLKTTINGYSGYIPQSYHDAVIALDSFPSEYSISFLKQKRIDYIIVHSRQYDDKKWTSLREQLSQSRKLRLAVQFDQDFVYTITQ
ncbi:hypothetical protein KKB64_03150 [Patescibacteria group bacterium]|nr:hypothetical protein [Patescibacteria group bacterium]MBU1472756.1 hypothetical protein [Patescibacteria group bacterium]MBU2460022.1 hypothetical protein [Patescibacteria group bacterium]MBU2544320.1 hypothetical protein [Patescibacteria group bacterium]